MSFNGSGSFLINTAGQPVVSGTVISSTAFNALTADLATGLSTCITKDGQTTVTANIPMANYKFTGLGAGSGAADSANLSQVQSTVVKLLASVSGTDTITAVGSPTVAAYAAGQMFYFVAAGDNTGAVTINIDSLGAKAVTRDGSVALAAGDIKSGEVVVIVYDGTRFQVVSQLNSSGDARFANVSIASALNVGGVATFTGGTANGVTYLNGSKALTSGSALVFDGTNLGIGTSSPAARLDVQTSGSASASFTNGTTNQWSVKVIQSGSTELQLSPAITGNNGPSIRSVTSGGAAYAPLTLDGSTITLKYAGTTGVLLDSAGNLGLGVTPSAWAAHTVFDIGARGSIFSLTSSGAFGFMQNAYWNGSAYIYKQTAAAAYYSQTSGIHYWYTAPSGTAGNTITFKEVLQINAAGQMLNYATSGNGGSFNVYSNGQTSGQITLGQGFSLATDNIAFLYNRSNADFVFGTNNTERARIGAGGEFIAKQYVKTDTYLWAAGVGNAGGLYLGSTGSSNGLISQASAGTATTTTYIGNQTITTSSDERLKANIKPTERNALELLNQWEIVDHTWNDPSDQCENNRNSRGVWTGVIAQQVQPITPWLVNKPLEDVNEDGTINPWVMDFGYSVPLLVKAIQELKSELDAAKVKISALEAK